MPAKSRPSVSHKSNVTKVFYPTSRNTHNSNVNRPAQVVRTSKGTTCIYKK